jgi:hypothetical protein
LCDIKSEANKIVEGNLPSVCLEVPLRVGELEGKNAAVVPIVVVGWLLLPELPTGLMRCRDVMAVGENDIRGDG